MSDGWYIHRDGTQHGPYSWEQLLSFARGGKLSDKDLFWNQDAGDWKKADQVPGLLPEAAPQRATPPATPGSGTAGRPAAVQESPRVSTIGSTSAGLNYQVLGSVMPVVEIQLRRDERLYAQTGAMKWMNDRVRMDTEMKGGLMGGLKRKVSGESMFVVYFTGLADGGMVSFGHSYPGHIIPIDVSRQPIICQRRAFLCAFDTVTYEVHFQRRLGAGFFGGEGFIMQKLSGSGTAFVEIDGECIERTLGAGESIRVETGAVGAFEQSVTLNIERVKGFKNIFMGGEGLFLTTLTGPGKIWIQSMPIQSMSAELFQFMPKSSS